MIELFPKLIEYGFEFFAIGALLYLMKMFLGFLKNHMNHSSEAIEKLAESIHELVIYLKGQNS